MFHADYSVLPGAGYVERVGSGVTVAQPGDPVLLSFNYCGQCGICNAGCPAHCMEFNRINFDGSKVFSPFENGPISLEEQPDIAGVFFGQSSFSSLSIADEHSVVNVKGLVSGPEDLKVLAPLGCGIQTGSGSILKVASASEKDAVAVLGMGGGGISGIMVSQNSYSPPNPRRDQPSSRQPNYVTAEQSLALTALLRV